MEALARIKLNGKDLKGVFNFWVNKLKLFHQYQYEVYERK